MKKYRKLILTFVVCCMMVIMSGCSGHKEEITKTAEVFLQALVDADVETASKVCTDAVRNHEELGIHVIDASVIATMFYDSMGIEDELLTDEIRKAIAEMSDAFAKSIFDNYSIVSVREENGVGIVEAKITTLSENVEEPFENENFDAEVNKLLEDYENNNFDDLQQVYLEGGEDALYAKIFNDLVPELIAYVQKALVSIEKEEGLLVFKVECVEGQWLVTEYIEEVKKPGKRHTLMD